MVEIDRPAADVAGDAVAVVIALPPEPAVPAMPAPIEVGQRRHPPPAFRAAGAAFARHAPMQYSRSGNIGTIRPQVAHALRVRRAGSHRCIASPRPLRVAVLMRTWYDVRTEIVKHGLDVRMRTCYRVSAG